MSFFILYWISRISSSELTAPKNYNFLNCELYENSYSTTLIYMDIGPLISLKVLYI